jgi:2-polyprenyl-3-methyl-5-hydroxy-6-metoxy-1,4-benzoquinol methylase
VPDKFVENRRTYRNGLYESYVSTHVSNLRRADQLSGPADERFYRANFLGVLPKNRDAKILDLGCGSGGFVHFLHKAGYSNAIGVDISPEQIDLGNRSGVSGLILADVGQFLEMSTERFEAVVAIDFVEHLRKDELLVVLGQIHRVLIPRGRLVMHTVNADSPFFGHYRYGDLTHELALNARSLAQAVKAAGFLRCDVRGVSIQVHGPASAARWILWQFLASLVRSYLIVETGIMRGHVVTQSLIAVAHRA